MLRNRNARPTGQRSAFGLATCLAMWSIAAGGFGIAQERPALDLEAGFAGRTLPTFVQFENGMSGTPGSETPENSASSWRLLLDPTPLVPPGAAASRFEPTAGRAPETAPGEPPRDPARALDATASTTRKDEAAEAREAKAPRQRSMRRDGPATTGTTRASRPDRARRTNSARPSVRPLPGGSPLPSVLRLGN
jgi:hypothetical protein